MNILLPTDFSENAKNAAVYAMNFFKDIPCSFHLLHVLPVTPHLDHYHIQPSQSVQNNFEHLLEDLNLVRTNKNHTFHVTFKVDFLIEAVRNQVMEKNIDLILMGTKGASTQSSSVVGKNTSDVMMKVKCPVLAISEKTIFNGHKEVLFPTDYKVAYKGKMLETLLNLIALSHASVRILEIFNSEKEPSPEQSSNKEFLQNMFLPEMLSLQTFYRSPDNQNKFFNFNENIDMIVLAAKNLNICNKLLKNQKNNQIPFINQLPLLVLH